jgi:hypothetical protein
VGVGNAGTEEAREAGKAGGEVQAECAGIFSPKETAIPPGRVERVPADSSGCDPRGAPGPRAHMSSLYA